MITKIRSVVLSFALLSLITISNALAIPDPDGDGNSAPWIAQYSVSSAFAKVGKPVTVQWQSFFTYGCSLWTNQTGSRSVSTSGSTTVTPNSPTTMSVRLTCSGASGRTTSQTRSFSVNKFDHPELHSLNVSASSASVGQQVTLSWSSSYSDYCELTGTNTDTLPPNGSKSFFVLSGTNSYKLTCRKYDGRNSNSLYKTVIGQSSLPIIVFFYIDNTSPSNPFYYVQWSAVADSCFLDGTRYGPNGFASMLKGPFSFIHRLTCYRSGKSVTASRLYSPHTYGLEGPLRLEAIDNTEVNQP